MLKKLTTANMLHWTNKLYQWIRTSDHALPIIAAAVLLTLTLLRLSGTSVGLYNVAYYGPDVKDQDLIANHPRSIRSDELLFNTPYIVGQVKNGSPATSDSPGIAQNMSVITDAPYKEWSILFRPQNWSFFFMPLEYAFAFKWWLLGLLLIVSCYYLCLELLPGKRLWASLISLGVFFSPFVQWWYQISTTACLFYSFFAILLVIKLLKPKISSRRRILLGSLLSYVLACFGVILYPPFQIPCVLIAAAFLLGYYLEEYRKGSFKQHASRLAPVVISAGVAVIILILFVLTRMPVVEAVTNTAYPGKRIILSGGYNISHFFSSYLAPFFQSDTRATGYPLNQSEASRFFILSPFLLVPSALLIWRNFRKKRALPWALLFINLALILLLCRLFFPHFNFIFHALQLSSTPLNRLMLGFGLLGVLQIILLSRLKDPAPSWCQWSSSALAFIISLIAGIKLGSRYSEFVPGLAVIIFLSLLMGAIVWCLQQKGRGATIGLSLLLALSFVSTCNVNPIYRGLKPLTDSAIAKAIHQTGDNKDSWAVADTRLLAMQPFADGRRMLTGVYAYPQPDVWKSLNSEDAPANTYNRFAHTILQLDPGNSSAKTTLNLVADDYFTINTGECSPFLRQSGVDYIITMHELTSSCTDKVNHIIYPQLDFYIYKLKP